MKKVKVFFWLLILGLIALVVFQNQGYFLDTQQVLRLNLKVFPEYQSPSLPVVAFHLLFLFSGCWSPISSEHPNASAAARSSRV